MFRTYPIGRSPGVFSHEGGDPRYPSTISSLHDALHEFGQPADTYYIFAHTGAVEIQVNGRGRYFLTPGMYARVPGRVVVSGGQAVVVARHGHSGTFLIGGPIEESGRLRYIDGCTDSLLLSPDRLGDPCLNHLHFPPNIDQTMHTHPSCRLGVVHRGMGVCVTPDQEFPLTPGTLFVLPVEKPHKFRTGPVSMDVIAYHPDSDHGPADEDHPMLNRTIVGGISARHLDAIRTVAP